MKRTFDDWLPIFGLGFMAYWLLCTFIFELAMRALG